MPYFKPRKLNQGTALEKLELDQAVTDALKNKLQGKFAIVSVENLYSVMIGAPEMAHAFLKDLCLDFDDVLKRAEKALGSDGVARLQSLPKKRLSKGALTRPPI